MLPPTALSILLLSAPTTPAAAEATPLAVPPAPMSLTVALVEDHDFPPLDERMIDHALRAAAAQFSLRFGVPAPHLQVRYRFDLDRFISLYAYRRDPACQALFAARYTGGGAAQLAPYKEANLKFFRRWSVGALLPFLPEAERRPGASYPQIYDFYTRHYPATVARLAALKTPTGSPLVTPKQSLSRSFVGWLCALKRQADYDVILTNTFILADLMTEPHPHSVLGKAKIGGIAVRSRGARVMDGQALLATTFAIDTPIPSLSELNGQPASIAQRADILGTYLLAHEIGHAVFGIPDVYDHPPGCLMTSRPGSSYLQGLRELRAHPTACPKCQPWVQARRALERGRALVAAQRPTEALQALRQAIRGLPRQFHGSRRRRLAEASVLSSKAYAQLGQRRRACRYAQVAYRLDPSLPGSREQRALCPPAKPPKTQTATQARPAKAQTATRAATPAPRLGARRSGARGAMGLGLWTEAARAWPAGGCGPAWRAAPGSAA